MEPLFASDANARIVQGNLPQTSLCKVSCSNTTAFDFFERGKDSLVYFRRNPASLYDAITSSLSYVAASDYLLSANNYEAPFNIVINTGYNPEAISEKMSAHIAEMRLCPVVTNIDKALWLIISSLALLVSTDNENKEDIVEQFFAWLYLLKIVQDNEYIFGKTLDFSSVAATSPVLDILWSPWSARNTYANFIDLTPSELDAIRKLELARKDLKQEIADDISRAAQVAAETEREWDLFLRILNDYAQEESRAINQVVDDSLSAAEKLAAIEAYFSILGENSKDHHNADGETIEITPVVEAAKKRLQCAPSYCIVSDNSGQVFRLHNYATELALFPMTFNLLLLVYHQFRLDPQQDSALGFCNFALHYLKRNLSFVAEEFFYESVEIFAEEFCNEFRSFVEANQDHIKCLSFNDVQLDNVFIGYDAFNAVAASVLQDHIAEKFESAGLSLKNLKVATNGQNRDYQYTKEDLNSLFAEEQEYAKKAKAQIVARQAVTSLNIVYLFCDVLKILSDTTSCHSFIANIDIIDGCEDELRRLHSNVAQYAYKNVNIKAYRKKAGIYADVLAKKESSMELFRANTFISICRKYVSHLNEGIVKGSIDGLLDVNRRFRAEMLRCLPFIQKEAHTKEWEDVSNRICHSLVETIEAESPQRLLKEKQSILAQLGTEARFLPDSALKTLATAEFLFQKYACPEYQESGFDYSSISALYYQAFEDSYNTLIWREYVKRLNDVRIGSQGLAEYFFSCKASKEEISNPSALGYLPKKAVNKYIKNPTCFHESITFEIFYELLKGISGKEKLDRLCDFFAEIAGHSSRQSMFADGSFIAQVNRFANKIYRKKDNRNEASHGGNIITFRECEDDKKAVLFDLQNIRDDTISLIQLLLDLIKDSKLLETHNH